MKYFQNLFLIYALAAFPLVVEAQEPPASNPPPMKSEALAEKVPAPSKELITSTKPFDAVSQKQISEFIVNRSEKILHGDDKQVRQATTDVLSLLRQSAATPIFLRTCFENLKSSVTTILATDNSFRCINILELVRWTQTPEAVDILIGQITPSIQKNPAIRIGASRLLPSCIASAGLNAPQIDRAARRIREASEEETQWIVSMHELQSVAALVTIAQNPNKQDLKLEPQLKNARDEFLKILAGTASKVSNPKLGGTDQIFALQRGLIILRDILLKTPKDQITLIAVVIRPTTQMTTQLSSQIIADKNITNESIKDSAKSAAITAGAINTLLGVKPAATPAKTPA